MALDDEIALFAQVPMFEGFQTEQLRLLAFGAEKRVLGAGDILFRENDLADCAYIVIAGKVVALSPGSKLALNEGTRTIETHGRGALIQPMALISNIKRPFGAMCEERTDLFRISRVLFTRMLTEYPDLAVMLRERIGAELVRFVSKLEGVLADLDAADDHVANRSVE